MQLSRGVQSLDAPQEHSGPQAQASATGGQVQVGLHPQGWLLVSLVIGNSWVFRLAMTGFLGSSLQSDLNGTATPFEGWLERPRTCV